MVSPIEDVVAHHPGVWRDTAKLYPGLIEPEDLMTRKTGFSAAAAGDLLEALAEDRWDIVVVAG